MSRLGSAIAVVLIGAATCACTVGRKSAVGFHLPEGDIEKGRAAFAELRCHTCHYVHDVDFPAPVADPPVPVVLGGGVAAPRTDGYLVAAIIDPSHRVPGHYRAGTVRSGKLSRMGDYSETMTVRQLIDLVAFLQSTYEVLPPSAPMGDRF
jgi:L-cysteine S-thiosulfotransferase